MELDDIDQALVRLLVDNARLANSSLAAAVGIAPSTCLARVQKLRKAGVISGFHAAVDLAALGLPLQAFIAVDVRSHARARILAVAEELAALPGVLDVFFTSGARDFQLHVASASSTALRDFVVDHLSAHPDVVATETNLIFHHVRSGATPGLQGSGA